MDQLVYKIMSDTDWTVAKSTGKYKGSVAEKDGFIPLATMSQISRSYRGEKNLVAAVFDSQKLGEKLRWVYSAELNELVPRYYDSSLPVRKPFCLQGILNYHPTNACLIDRL